jgi:hypothetical protein
MRVSSVVFIGGRGGCVVMDPVVLEDTAVVEVEPFWEAPEQPARTEASRSRAERVAVFNVPVPIVI